MKSNQKNHTLSVRQGAGQTLPPPPPPSVGAVSATLISVNNNLTTVEEIVNDIFTRIGMPADSIGQQVTGGGILPLASLADQRTTQLVQALSSIAQAL